MSSADCRITFAGAAHFDESIRLTETLHPGASNPVTWSRSIGGVASNASRAASALAPTSLIATIGSDAAGNHIQTYFQQSVINAAFYTLHDQPTGRYGVVLDQQGELIVGLAATDICQALSYIELTNQLKKLPSTDVLVIDANLSASCLKDVCIHKPVPRLAALAVSPVKSMRLLDHATAFNVLIANRAEASMLTGSPRTRDITELSSALEQAGFHNHIITDGSAPLIVRENGSRPVLVELKPIKVATDVNGAGDALAGATLAGWARGKTLHDSVTSLGIPAATAVLSGASPAPELS